MPYANSLDPDKPSINLASHQDPSCLTLRQHFHLLWTKLKHSEKLKQTRNSADDNWFGELRVKWKLSFIVLMITLPFISDSYSDRCVPELVLWCKVQQSRNHLCYRWCVGDCIVSSCKYTHLQTRYDKKTRKIKYYFFFTYCGIFDRCLLMMYTYHVGAFCNVSDLGLNWLKLQCVFSRSGYWVERVNSMVWPFIQNLSYSFTKLKTWSEVIKVIGLLTKNDH